MIPNPNKEPILHITWNMSIGGAEKAIFQLIRAQRDSGRTADLLVSTEKGIFGSHAETTGARVLFLGQRHAADISIRNKFLKIIHDYNILHFHGASPLLMYIAARKKEKKLFYTHRGGRHSFSKKRLLMYKITGLLIKRYFCGISGNTEHAAHCAAALFKIPREKVLTTYNGIDFSLLNPRRDRDSVLRECGETDDGTLRIATSANLRNLKRVDLLVRAIGRMPELPIRAFIIGDGPAKKALQRLVSEMQIETKVKFIGKTEHIGDYLQFQDIFVLLSDGSESFGNSAVEAMGLGIPTVVMRDGGGLLEHMAGNEELIADDLEDLVKIIKKLVASPSLRKEAGRKGKNYVVNKYSYKNMNDGYEKLYAHSELLK